MADFSLTWPLSGTIISIVGDKRPDHIHEGYDIHAPQGTPVHAAGRGEVTGVRRQSGTGAGLYVNVAHPDKASGRVQTQYMHLSAADVTEGQRVTRRTVIGRTGDTGSEGEFHLHFQMNLDGTRIDLGLPRGTKVRLGEAIRHDFPGVAADVIGIASLGDAYWQAHADGAVDGLAGAGALGGANGQPLVAPVAAISRTPSGGGYLLAAEDGGVFAFGDGEYKDRAQGVHIASVATDPLGRGYWLASVEGRVLPFGAGVPDLGSASGLAAPVVAIVARPTGNGYWLVAADGGVFAFGDAPFRGAGPAGLKAPIVAAAATWDGEDYWLLGSDGGVFAMGNAPYLGNAAGSPEPVFGIAPMAGKGYRLVDAAGTTHPFPA
jgi:hypothetical protein